MTSWSGLTCKPDEELPGTFKPPEGYTVHAELIIEDVPVEHGLLMENLLDDEGPSRHGRSRRVGGAHAQSS